MSGFFQYRTRGGMHVRIVVITGSPHRNGTSALLADKFIQGATEAGNEVYRFDAAFENVHPCIGCDTCECGKRPCVFKDGMTGLYAELLKADMVVFVTPLYYHAMSSQIKMAVDRFHGIDDLLRGTDKKAMLLVSAASTDKRIMNGRVRKKAVRFQRRHDRIVCGVIESRYGGIRYSSILPCNVVPD